MSIEIRLIRETDVDVLAKISASIELFSQYGSHLDLAKKNLKADLTNPLKKIYVAECAGEVCAMASLVERGAFNLSGYIQQIFVSLQHSGRGIGKALLSFVERKHGRERGIMLLVNSENQSAIKFYHSLGYQQVGRIDSYVKPGLNELIFFKRAELIDGEG